MDTAQINDLYSLAISQILQKDAQSALITIDQILKEDPSNSYILLAKSAVEAYQFKKGRYSIGCGC